MRALFTLFIVASAAFAQTPDPGKYAPIKDRFDKFVADKEVVGSVVLVGRKNGIEYVSASGMANIPAIEPSAPASHHIGEKLRRSVNSPVA